MLILTTQDMALIAFEHKIQGYNFFECLEIVGILALENQQGE